MSKFIILIAVGLLTACSPARLQSSQVIDYRDDKPVYAMTGYTGYGETEAGSSKRYIRNSMVEACPAGVEIIETKEYDAHNGCCKFLYWQAKAMCR